MNYPNGINKEKTSYINYGNRGMSLESDINISNEQYRNSDIAYIYKKPTPIKVLKVEYNSKNKPIIKNGFYSEPSTTDYNGLYKGFYIDFEAKETKNKSFPLSNIHNHQIIHLHNIKRHNGIAFLIVRFTNLGKTYLLMEEHLDLFIKNNTKKSIPISYFDKYGFIIKEKLNPRVDYLEIIEKIIEENL